MLDVTIDAGVIAVPEPVVSADVLHNYVDTLLDWSSLLDETWVSTHISAEASAALFANDCIQYVIGLRRSLMTTESSNMTSIP